jgi:hypothetical protein
MEGGLDGMSHSLKSMPDLVFQSGKSSIEKDWIEHDGHQQGRSKFIEAVLDGAHVLAEVLDDLK